MWILTGANFGLLLVGAMFLLVVVAMFYRPPVLDFVKGNFGLLVLVLLFMTLLAISFHVFHEASGNPASKDFLAWLEQKAGEVLASVMTVIVGAKATNQRASDNGNGSTSGSKTSTSTVTSASITGEPHP